MHSRRYINRQRIREISKKIAKLRNHRILFRNTNPVFWIALKRNTFRMSIPKVIMIANTFTMSILRVPLKPNTFVVSFPEMIMIANVFTSQKHQISRTTQKKVLGFKAKLKNDVTRQAKCVGDSYRREHTFPAIYELLMHKYHDKT